MLFLPLGGTVSLKNDPKFNGAYKELQDMNTQLAPKPGVIFLNNRSLGGSDRLSKAIAEIEWSEALLKHLAVVGFKYIVLRSNLDAPYRPFKELDAKALQNSSEVSLVYSGKDFLIYEFGSFKGSVKIVEYRGKESVIPYKQLSNSAYIVEVESSEQIEQTGITLSQAYDNKWNAIEINLEEFRKLKKHEPRWFSPIWIYAENLWLLNKTKAKRSPIQNGSYGMLWPSASLFPCIDDSNCSEAGKNTFFWNIQSKEICFLALLYLYLPFLL